MELKARLPAPGGLMELKVEMPDCRGQMELKSVRPDFAGCPLHAADEVDGAQRSARRNNISFVVPDSQAQRA